MNHSKIALNHFTRINDEKIYNIDGYKSTTKEINRNKKYKRK